MTYLAIVAIMTYAISGEVALELLSNKCGMPPTLCLSASTYRRPK